MQTQIEALKIQLDQLESELESMECTSKKKKTEKESVSLGFWVGFFLLPDIHFIVWCNSFMIQIKILWLQSREFMYIPSRHNT